MACLLALGCGTTATEDRAAGPETQLPQFGGALVDVAGHPMELVVHESGEVHLHPRGDTDLGEASASVTLPTTGEPHALALRWEDRIQGFTGRLESAPPRTGTAQVLLVYDGHLHEGEARLEHLLPTAEHEGSVVHVGEHDVEVAVDPDGRASAWVLDDPTHRLELDLTLNLPGEDGHLHPLSLSWDEELARYVGELEGLHPRPGPLELIAVEGGAERLGHGSLLGVGRGPREVGVPHDLQLEIPELGSNLPGVIAIPSSSDGASSDGASSPDDPPAQPPAP